MWSPQSSLRFCLVREQLFEDIRHDSARPEVGRLDRRIDSHQERYRVSATVQAFDAKCPGLTCARHFAGNEIEPFAAVERQALRTDTLRKLTGQHTHAEQVGPMDTLESPCNHRAHAERAAPLAAQSRELPAP